MVDVIPPQDVFRVPIEHKAVTQVEFLTDGSPDIEEMKNKKVPYKELDSFVDTLRAFQEQDMDVLLPITGFKGGGKTTLGIDIAKKYLEKYTTETFDPSRHICYDNYDVQQALNKLPPYSPILCDEAVRFAMGEDWQRGESKELKKLLTQIRTKHFIILFCIPEFWWLDKKYREDMTIFWIHVFCRGYSLIFTPDLRIGLEDHWHRKEFQKGITRTINIFTPINDFLPYYRKHPCYWADMSFYKCDERLYERYLKIRDAKALAPSPTVVRTDLVKLILWKLKKQFGFSNAKLSLYLQNPDTKLFPFTSNETTGQVVNDWVTEMEQRFRDSKLDLPIPKVTKKQEEQIENIINPQVITKETVACPNT